MSDAEPSFSPELAAKRGHSVRWELVPPPEPCTSPDGHWLADIMEWGSSVPFLVRCCRCGRIGEVVVFEDEEAP